MLIRITTSKNSAFKFCDLSFTVRPLTRINLKNGQSLVKFRVVFLPPCNRRDLRVERRGFHPLLVQSGTFMYHAVVDKAADSKRFIQRRFLSLFGCALNL